MPADKIAIIGGGVSGLMMMKLLLARGYDVTLFEAQREVGGRVKKGTFKGHNIDLGAQWLHHVNGAENSLTQLLKEAGEPFVSDEDEGEYTAEVNTYLDELKRTSFTEDLPLSATIKDPSLKKYIDAMLVDMASSSDHFSTIEFIKQIETVTTDDYLLENRSMSAFIAAYFSDLPQDRILLSTPVTAINYSTNQVAITTAQGISYHFNKAILSVPISQLQNRKISFTPELPAAKQAAIQKIGIGKGLKVFFFFKQEVLTAGTFNNDFAPYYFPVDIAPYHVIITLLMGQFAENYYRDPATYKEGMIQELSAITQTDIAGILEGTVFHDWGHEPYIEGTYSFPLPGEGDARAIAAAPIDNTLFFIGEAMNTGFMYGFIHGAMDTAIKLIEQL